MSKQGQPSRKMLSVNLLNCVRTSEVDKSWRFSNKDFQITLRHVWLQGEVTQCNADRDQFTLQDTLGTVQVMGCKKVPSGVDMLRDGLYVLVIGELKAASPVPVVKAVKIQNIDDEPNLREIWPLEVQDQHQVLAEMT